MSDCPYCGTSNVPYQVGVGCFRCQPAPDPRTKEQLLAKLKIAQRELQVLKSANRNAWKRIAKGDEEMISLLRRWYAYGQGTNCTSVTLMDATKKVLGDFAR